MTTGFEFQLNETIKNCKKGRYVVVEVLTNLIVIKNVKGTKEHMITREAYALAVMNGIITK